jgi:gallate decarboxylase subunit D
METVTFSEGTGRTKVQFAAQWIGRDLLVRLFNAQAHIGAVAIADYHSLEKRVSTSVITRLGHKDDAVACQAAHRLCKDLTRPVCAIAGIHVDDITESEISEIVRNCDRLVSRFLEQAAVKSG